MKKTVGIALGALLLSGPLAATDVKAADDSRVYYNKGTVFEAPAAGFDLKINTLIQTYYQYESIDGGVDRNDFEVNRARLIFSGNALNKEFSYYLQGDFVGGKDDGSTDGKKSADLRDAYIQWNYCAEEGRLRMGQWKMPYSNQYLIADNALQIPTNAAAVNEFNLGRNQGAAIYSTFGNVGMVAGVFNGHSDGEGVNRPAKDTDLAGAGQVYYISDGYDRWYEGDYNMTEGVGYTFGLSGSVEQAEYETDVNTDMVHLSADAGLKSNGYSLNGEFFFRNSDTDQDDSSASNDIGYYIQTGYFIVPKDIEIVGRFSGINYDAADSDTYEYSFALNKYFSTALKVQGVVSFLNEEPSEGDSTTDSRYQLFVTGLF